MTWVAVSRTNHRDKTLRRGNDCSFAKKFTLVPICRGETVTATSTLPLVFSPSKSGHIEFCGVLGLEKEKNLFVLEDGSSNTIGFV